MKSTSSDQQSSRWYHQERRPVQCNIWGTRSGSCSSTEMRTVRKDRPFNQLILYIMGYSLRRHYICIVQSPIHAVQRSLSAIDTVEVVSQFGVHFKPYSIWYSWGCYLRLVQRPPTTMHQLVQLEEDLYRHEVTVQSTGWTTLEITLPSKQKATSTSQPV